MTINDGLCALMEPYLTLIVRKSDRGTLVSIARREPDGQFSTIQSRAGDLKRRANKPDVQLDDRTCQSFDFETVFRLRENLCLDGGRA